MPFEHQGVVFPFKGGAGPQRNGAGDVGGPEEVLAAGIRQVQPVRLQQQRALLRCHIVRQGGRRPVGRYRLETVSLVTGHPGPDRAQIPGGLPLVHLSGTGAEPIKELLHHQAVLHMGFPHAFHFHRILDGLPGGNGRRNLQHFGEKVPVVDGIPEGNIQHRGVDADTVHSVQPERGEVEIGLGIILYLNPVHGHLVEAGGRFGIGFGEGVLADEPEGIVQGNQQVGKNQGIVVRISPADVQEPGNLVQGSQEDGIRPFADEPLAETVELALAAFAHEIFAQGDDGR